MKEVYFNKVQKWCLKPLRNILCCMAILLAATGALLHLPGVQQHLLHKALHYLHKTTHYHIKCDAIRLTWLQHIALVGIVVTDPQEKPLLSINECRSKLNLFSLLWLRPDIIDSVSGTGVQLYLEENNAQNLNIETFYTNAILPFLPEATTDFFIRRMQLNDLNLYYHKQIKQQNITIKNINLDVENFLSSANHHSGKIASLSYEETSDLPFILRNCITHFSITSHSITLRDCQLITQYSNLQGDFKLKNSKQLPLFSDKENIVLEAMLNETTLSSIELDQFSDFFQGVYTLYRLMEPSP